VVFGVVNSATLRTVCGGISGLISAGSRLIPQGDRNLIYGVSCVAQAALDRATLSFKNLGPCGAPARCHPLAA
jgi:hypothetical protein